MSGIQASTGPICPLFATVGEKWKNRNCKGKQDALDFRISTRCYCNFFVAQCGRLKGDVSHVGLGERCGSVGCIAHISILVGCREWSGMVGVMGRLAYMLRWGIVWSSVLCRLMWVRSTYHQPPATGPRPPSRIPPRLPLNRAPNGPGFA